MAASYLLWSDETIPLRESVDYVVAMLAEDLAHIVDVHLERTARCAQPRLQPFEGDRRAICLNEDLGQRCARTVGDIFCPVNFNEWPGSVDIDHLPPSKKARSFRSRPLRKLICGLD